MFGISQQSLMHSKGVFTRRPGFSVSSAFAAAILVLLALVGWPQRAMAFSSIPNQDTWVTNGTVWTIATAGSTVYLGGDFTYVGPNTGSGAPINAASGSPVSTFPKVNGTIWVVVSDGSGGWYIGGESLELEELIGTRSPTFFPTVPSTLLGTPTPTTRSMPWR